MCSVWVARRPPGYVFVDFDDSRDAEDAIRELDGILFKIVLNLIFVYLCVCVSVYLFNCCVIM